MDSDDDDYTIPKIPARRNKGRPPYTEKVSELVKTADPKKLISVCHGRKQTRADARLPKIMGCVRCKGDKL